MKYGIVHHFPGGTKAQYDARCSRLFTAQEPSTCTT